MKVGSYQLVRRISTDKRAGGLGMSLRAFRGGNPHERLVAISDPNLLGACRPTLCMIKDVIIFKGLADRLEILEDQSARGQLAKISVRLAPFCEHGCTDAPSYG